MLDTEILPTELKGADAKGKLLKMTKRVNSFFLIVNLVLSPNKFLSVPSILKLPITLLNYQLPLFVTLA